MYFSRKEAASKRVLTSRTQRWLQLMTPELRNVLTTTTTMQNDSHKALVERPTPVERPWIQVVSHLDPEYGGLSAVVPQIATHIAHAGDFPIEIAAFCTPNENSTSSFDGVRVTRWPSSRKAWLQEKSLETHFSTLLSHAQGVHIHGLWEQSTAVAARVACSMNKPYLISAHGMLDPWALRNKRLKKLLYAAAIERPNVRRATCLQALTQAEANDYRRFGARGPIAIIPNGVEIPDEISPEPFFEKFPQLRGRRLLLFLGRIHYKKGVDLLVRSWAELAAANPEAHLVLAGPDFEGTRARTEELIQQLGIGERVTFTGMLRDQMKWSALAAASLFLLPSFSEGFSVAVLEAMATGLPVIISHHCHLPEVGDGFAGWVVQSEQASLTSSMQKFLFNTPEMNDAMGVRGRQLVCNKYSWPAIAAQINEVYRWLAGGPQPVHVAMAPLREIP